MPLNVSRAAPVAGPAHVKGLFASTARRMSADTATASRVRGKTFDRRAYCLSAPVSPRGAQFRRMGLFYNVLFFMGGVALHASLTQRAQPPSASLLEQADCSRVQLSAGRTCYRLDGPEDAPLVVLVHGFSGSHLNWAKTRESLVAAEFRVLS